MRECSKANLKENRSGWQKLKLIGVFFLLKNYVRIVSLNFAYDKLNINDLIINQTSPLSRGIARTIQVR